MANEKPAKALELLPEYAETDPWLLIELHKAAGKIGAVKEKRYKWLEKYAAEADKKANEINVNGVSIRLKEYQHGILSLQGYSDYDGMLFLLAAMEKTTSESDKKTRDYWDVLTSKGLALRRLGRKD